MAVVVEVKVVVRGGAGGGDGRCHRRRGRHRRFLKAAAAVFNVVVTTGVRVSKDIQSHRRPVSVKCYEWRTDWLWKSSGTEEGSQGRDSRGASGPCRKSRWVLFRCVCQRNLKENEDSAVPGKGGVFGSFLHMQLGMDRLIVFGSADRKQLLQ